VHYDIQRQERHRPVSGRGTAQEAAGGIVGWEDPVRIDRGRISEQSGGAGIYDEKHPVYRRADRARRGLVRASKGRKNESALARGRISELRRRYMAIRRAVAARERSKICHEGTKTRRKIGGNMF